MVNMGAQIDKYGNTNSTVRGPDPGKPKVRLPGRGGAMTWPASAEEMMITPYGRRRFVERVDFITSPGYLGGKGDREAAGLPPGTGPYKVIIDIATLGFSEEAGEMVVESIHPGVSHEHVVAATGSRPTPLRACAGLLKG